MHRLKRSIILFIFSFLSILQCFAFSTKNGNIFDENGNQISIDGVAWIGFQDSNFLGGLWNVAFNPIGTQNGVIQLLTAPWTVPNSNITSKNNGVSFKAIRLAMQPGIWHNVNTTQSSPFDFSRTSISTPDAGNGPFCDWTAGADGSGRCIKTKSAPNLLNAVINEFGKQNILIMLDFHHRPGLGDGFRDGTVVAADYSLQTYHDDVVNFVKNAPANILGVDLYNEPHKLFWFQDNTQTSPAQPSWIKVIAAAAAAIYDTNPKVLLFVEGPGGTQGNDPFDPVYSTTSPICLPSNTKIDDPSVINVTNDTTRCSAANPLRVNNIGVNWGENFRALLDTTQAKNGIAKFDTIKFRTMLTQAITANHFSNTDPNLIADWLLGTNNDGNNGHLVFAPHLYGAQVGGWQSDANDSQIRFKWNFGFVLDSGFPFVIGEIGYDVQIPGKGGEDFFLESVAPYLINKKMNHSLFFWTWNHDDYPVGIRTDDSGLGLFAWKEQDLYSLFNAIPPVQDFGTLCITVSRPTNYTGTSFPTITANAGSSYTFNMTSFDQPLCLSNVVTGTYNLTGSTLTNPDGISFVPQQNYTATVTKNTQTDVTVQYVQEPTGILNVSISGDSNCTIAANQLFTVTYTKNAISKQLQVTGTTPANVTIPTGSYTIAVTPDPLTTNQQCHAQYGKTVSITANTTTQEKINYTFTQPAACTVKAQCSTWGTPQDSWSGSSCNFYINSPAQMSKPTIFTMQAIGIKSLTGVWNATGSITNGNVVLELLNPVYVTNVGFNATGVITLPPQASVSTNGQTLTCDIVKM